MPSLAAALGLFALIVVVHEAAHYVAARALGYRPRYRLRWFGPVVVVPGVKGPDVGTIAAAGPFASGALLALLWQAGQGFGVLLSIDLLVWNLLPVWRTDGRKMLLALRGRA